MDNSHVPVVPAPASPRAQGGRLLATVVGSYSYQYPSLTDDPCRALEAGEEARGPEEHGDRPVPEDAGQSQPAACQVSWQGCLGEQGPAGAGRLPEEGCV